MDANNDDAAIDANDDTSNDNAVNSDDGNNGNASNDDDSNDDVTNDDVNSNNANYNDTNNDHPAAWHKLSFGNCFWWVLRNHLIVHQLLFKVQLKYLALSKIFSQGS